MRRGWAGTPMVARTGLERLAQRYRRFALNGMGGESEVGQQLTLAVARSPELLTFIAGLPANHRHPNLFLAAVRSLHGVPRGGDHLLEIVRQDPEAIRRIMLSRTTQTNEPARCTALLPLLARLPQPLAIVEVGASAGLCLLPDRYGYDYGYRLEPADATAGCIPIFPCAATGDVPYPRVLPRIVWRRGLDLSPVDVRSEEQMSWLEMLVWPGQDERVRRLRAAVGIARHDPPPVIRGDLLDDLAPLLAQAPKGATLVVFHTAVLQYVPSLADRAQFVETLRNANAVWISNEPPETFPSLARDIPPPSRPGRFLLMLDGEPVAWTGPHGQSLDWLPTR